LVSVLLFFSRYQRGFAVPTMRTSLAGALGGGSRAISVHGPGRGSVGGFGAVARGGGGPKPLPRSTTTGAPPRSRGPCCRKLSLSVPNTRGLSGAFWRGVLAMIFSFEGSLDDEHFEAERFEQNGHRHFTKVASS
jgi:hypothetical protein